MKLEHYRQGYDYFSGKASELARQLAFAGIAVVWIFHVGEGAEIQIDDRFAYPLILFCYSLAFDLLHYVSSTVLWGLFSRSKEKQLVHKTSKSNTKIVVPNMRAENPPRGFEANILAPRWLNWPANWFFYLKVTAVLVGYVILIGRLSSMLP